STASSRKPAEQDATECTVPSNCSISSKSPLSPNQRRSSNTRALTFGKREACYGRSVECVGADSFPMTRRRPLGFHSRRRESDDRKVSAPMLVCQVYAGGNYWAAPGWENHAVPNPDEGACRGERRAGYPCGHGQGAGAAATATGCTV